MNFKVLCLLWTIVFLTIKGEILAISMCCPIGWTLVKPNYKISNYVNEYDCVISGNPKEILEIIDGDSEISAHNNNISLSSRLSNDNLPHCEAPPFVSISGKIGGFHARPLCLATLTNKLIAVPCNSNKETTPLGHLDILHKCCPADYMYDSSVKKCKKLNISVDSIYERIVQHSVVLINGPFNCPQSNVLVEYHLSAESIVFKDSNLLLSNSKVFKINEYCIEAIVNDGQMGDIEDPNFIVRTCQDDHSICRRSACIRRCCSDGEMFSKGNATSYCKADESDISFHSFESLQISGNFTKPAVFGILRSLDCRKFRLDPDTYPDEAHSINENDGSLYVWTTKRKYTNNQYCVEKIYNSSYIDQKLYTFLCFDSKVVGNDRIRFKLYPIGLLISCSFYALTLLVYLSISKLRNLPGKILICLVSSLFSAYLAIALGQLMPTPNDDICFVFGFFVYFCLMAAFAWMNVMCFDIWQTFGSAKKKHGFKKNHIKQFLFYSLYGWGLPTILTITTVSLTKSSVLSENIRPHFGHGRCWFTYDTLASANLLFFSGPVGVLFLINFFLFLLTLRYCNKVKREIFRMQSSNMEKAPLKRRFFVDKTRFIMNMKLCFVMGITWFLELLSILLYDHKKTFFWTISDSFNVLLGVFVFFIFVFKKRIGHTLLEKLGIRNRNSLKHGANNTCVTHSTFVQGMSMSSLNASDRISTPHSAGEIRRLSPSM